MMTPLNMPSSFGISVPGGSCRKTRTFSSRVRSSSSILRRIDGRDDGEAILLELDIDLRLVASVFLRIVAPEGLTVTAVDDDLEIVLEAKRQTESRDEVRAMERFGGHDAEASTLNCHYNLKAWKIVS